MVRKTPEPKRGRVNVSISRETHETLRAFADRQKYDTPLSKIVELAVIEHIQRSGK